MRRNHTRLLPCPASPSMPIRTLCRYQAPLAWPHPSPTPDCWLWMLAGPPASAVRRSGAARAIDKRRLTCSLAYYSPAAQSFVSPTATALRAYLLSLRQRSASTSRCGKSPIEPSLVCKPRLTETSTRLRRGGTISVSWLSNRTSRQDVLVIHAVGDCSHWKT
jgi:hypothetical protein